jgi:transposase
VTGEADGKHLINASDDYLSAQDVVLGYGRLHEIERVNRDLKHTVDIGRVYHNCEERIRAHVLVCWNGDRGRAIDGGASITSEILII